MNKDFDSYSGFEDACVTLRPSLSSHSLLLKGTFICQHFFFVMDDTNKKAPLAAQESAGRSPAELSYHSNFLGRAFARRTSGNAFQAGEKGLVFAGYYHFKE